jgi:hypothetical protein
MEQRFTYATGYPRTFFDNEMSLSFFRLEKFHDVMSRAIFKLLSQ